MRAYWSARRARIGYADVIRDAPRLARFLVWPASMGPAKCPVRSPLGRDGPNYMTRMGPSAAHFAPAPRRFGMGSDGEGGSVGPGKNY